MAQRPRRGMFQTFGGLREDDINTDGSGGFGSLEYLSSRSVGPIEPGRASSVYDPIEINAASLDSSDPEMNPDLWRLFVMRQIGGGGGGGGGRGGRSVDDGFGGRVKSALERGELILNEDGTLSPGPNYNENDAVITGIMNRVNSLIRESTEAEDDDTPAEQSLGSILDELKAEGATDADVGNAVDLYETIKGAIPTDLEGVKDLLESIIKSSAGISEECKTWTGRVGEGEGGSGSVPGSGNRTYQGWKDCFNLGMLKNIPGLDLPIPPGMSNITWKDLEDKIVEAGQSVEDFINDPAGWFEDKVEEGIQAVRDAWGDLTSGAVFSTKDLENVLTDILGGWISGAVLNEVKDAVGAENPFLLAGDCEDPAFREANEEFCNEALPIPVKEEEGQCKNGATNFPECTECPEGFQYFEGTKTCEPKKQAPIWQDDGPTAEDCAAQNRTHIPGNAETETDSKCGGCLSGYEPNTEGECEEESLEGPCPTEGQIRNSLGKCEDPVGFENGAPCKTPSNEDGTYDDKGNCVADPLPPEFGYCEDGTTVKTNAEGTNCAEYVSGTPDFGLCEDGVTAKQDEQGTNCPSIIIDDDPEPEEECPEGQFRNQFGVCQTFESEDPEAEECDNGATDWPLCSECPDGSIPSEEFGCEGPEEECPEGLTRDLETGECVPVEGGEESPETGGGGGGGGGGGMMSPFMAGINYQLPEIQPLVLPQAQPQRANDMMGGLLTKLIVDRSR